MEITFNQTSSNSLSQEQMCQELQYNIPYHYITQYSKNFCPYYFDSWGINYVSTIEFMLGQISKLSIKSFIDIGCGDGRFTREVAQAFPCIQVNGVDYSSRSIALATAMNTGLNFHVCDITKWEPDTLFDCANLMEVFEHIPLTIAKEFIKGVYKVLKPGGILFLTVPHLNEPVHAHHFRHFNIDTLKKEWEPFFDIVQIFGFERKGCLRHIISHCLYNRLFILRNRRLLNLLYTLYKRHLFFVKDETQAQRIFMKAVRKDTVI
jgi:2-polyprenyl-3-methyl-5-hydroxy-6-metoxy-1,4-benzoquinol methylase